MNIDFYTVKSVCEWGKMNALIYIEYSGRSSNFPDRPDSRYKYESMQFFFQFSLSKWFIFYSRAVRAIPFLCLCVPRMALFRRHECVVFVFGQSYKYIMWHTMIFIYTAHIQPPVRYFECRLCSFCFSCSSITFGSSTKIIWPKIYQIDTELVNEK